MELKMEVYSPTLELLGLLEIQNAVIWERRAFAAGSFSVNSLLTDEAIRLLQPENIIWIAGEDAGIIEYVQEEAGEDGLYLSVKGCDLTGVLSRRILWGLYALNGPVPELMYKLVDDCCINPTRGDVEARKIPGLALSNIPSGGASVRAQKTGGTLLEALEELGEAYQTAFGVRFDPAGPRMVFWARPGADRTIHQTENEPVFYSTELDDVLSSEYVFNAQNYRNIALVAGEGEGGSRVHVTVSGGGGDTPTPPSPTKYTVAVSVDPSGSGTVTGTGVYQDGEQVTLTATAADGYKFARWTVNGAEVGTGVSYTFTVTENVEVVAVFEDMKISRLPEGYTEVEYIQTDNHCGFSIGLKMNYSTTVISLDIKPESYVSGTEYFIMQIGDQGKNNYMNLARVEENTIRYRAYGSTAATNITKNVTGERILVEYNGPSRKMTIGNTDVTIGTSNVLSPYNFQILTTSATRNSPRSYLYGVTVRTGGALVSDLVPCIRSDNTVGLYDIVQQKFFKNEQTGVLTPGPAV